MWELDRRHNTTAIAFYEGLGCRKVARLRSTTVPA
jgi:ribosomal protein S18 acetylase RimI-like enzyme